MYRTTTIVCVYKVVHAQDRRPDAQQGRRAFLQQWTGEATLGDALLTSLQRLPNVKWLATTLGKKGSVLLEHCPNQQSSGTAVLQELLSTMLGDVTHGGACNGAGSSGALGCTTKDGISVQ